MTTIERVSLYSSTPQHAGALCSHSWLLCTGEVRVELARYTPEFGWQFATSGRKWGNPAALGYSCVRRFTDDETIKRALKTIDAIRISGEPHQCLTFGLF